MPHLAEHTLRLPNTCPQNRRQYSHVRLLTRVDPGAWNASGFDGPLFSCGARLSDEELGQNPVALECAGPQGNPRHGQKRDTLWVLWRWDRGEERWREIARALSQNWAWAAVLRGPAILALRPLSADLTVDAGERGREVTDELLRGIDSALLAERPEVRTLVLTSIYDQMAGRLVLAA